MPFFAHVAQTNTLGKHCSMNKMIL